MCTPEYQVIGGAGNLLKFSNLSVLINLESWKDGSYVLFVDEQISRFPSYVTKKS